MSNAKILLRALPNVEFVHGFPGIPAGPDRPHATIRGAIEVRLGNQSVKAKWVKVELRKIETIPGGNRGEEFVDLVGQSPITVWQAQDEQDTLSSKDFPFNIRVPETIPPSVALERGAGIKYEVVATLCTKGKKGLFRREASTPVSHSVPVVIDKHELHSTWPIYAQPESRHVVSDGLTLAIDRANTCFAPADRLSVIATLKSDNLTPVVLRGFEFSLRETIIYRTSPQSHGKKNGPQVQTTILGEQKVPVSMTLYGGTQHRAELGCVIPGNHTTSSVNAGRHIDIGYSLNIKALIDMAKPVTMDLPVTITNWPRHVSADMIRRIGTAPNLSLKPVASPRPGALSLPHTSETRASHAYGPPRPPPSGGLPSIPNGDETHRSVPPGALVSGPPGSPNLGQVTNAMNPYSFQQNPYSTQGQTSNIAPAPDDASQHPSIRSGVSSNEKGALAASSDTHATSVPGSPDEFGYSRQSIAVSATAPSRQSDKHDFGVIDVNQRPGSTSQRPSNSRQSTASDLDIGGSNRTSQYSQDADARANVVSSPTSSTGRRARAMSRPLKIMNANDDIPEEESPVKKEASFRPFDEALQPRQSTPVKSTAVSGSSTSSATPWPTADQEKQQLYEKAKAKAERVQALARGASESSSLTHTPRPSNGHVSPPREASPASFDQANGGERPRTVSPTPKTPWPTAEDEKQRLFERAQAKARRTQGLAHSPSPSTSSITRPNHNRTASATSTQDSHMNPTLGAYATASPPTMSAGAALYSHAMSSISRPASAVTPFIPPAASSAPRRNASYTGSGSIGSSSSAPSSTKQSVPVEEDKGALRYFEARKAVERRQREEGEIPENTPQEGPISYEELFGSSSNAASSSGPSAGAAAPQLSEKEVMRRAYEARDAAATANQPPAVTASASPAVTVQRTPSVRTMTPPTSPPPPLSEKEVLRRAFEARDAAMMRSGQTPPPIMSPVQPPPRISSPVQPPPPAMTPVQSPPPVRSPSWRGGSSSSVQPREKTPISEKERMRLAFEARDRALAAQQAPQPSPAPSPPDYDMPPPSSPGPLPPVWSQSGTGSLTAAEEKAQLQARYAAADAGAGMMPSTSPGLSSTPPPPTLERPPSPTRERPPSPTREQSFKSDSSETFLRRDPTISAGKKRASQMITPSPPSPPPPPPLPPRPPAEYIEETKLEDRRNTLVTSLPPSDFSSSFDLGFGTFGSEGSRTPPALSGHHAG